MLYTIIIIYIIYQICINYIYMYIYIYVYIYIYIYVMYIYDDAEDLLLRHG